MADNWQRQSPLAHRGLAAHGGEAVAEAALVMAERRFLAKVTVRGKADSDAAGAALGASLPSAPNTVDSRAGLDVLWLGPDEWLVIGPPGSEHALVRALEDALRDAAIVDVTEGRTTLRLRGPLVRDILATGCPLDLHPRRFASGRCAQSTLGRSAVILHQTADDPVFDIHVERSQADYLWTWLETAGRPYGVAVEAEPEPQDWHPPSPGA